MEFPSGLGVEQVTTRFQTRRHVARRDVDPSPRLGLTQLSDLGCEDGLHDPPDGIEVLGIDDVDEDSAHGADVMRCCLFHHGLAVPGDARRDTTTIVWIGGAAHQAVDLHARDRLDEAGSVLPHQICQGGHAQSSLGSRGKIREDLVLAEVQPVEA